MAATLNVATDGAMTLALAGCMLKLGVLGVMGAALTLKLAGLLATLPKLLLTSTRRRWPFMAALVAGRLKVAAFALAMSFHAAQVGAVSAQRCHW